MIARACQASENRQVVRASGGKVGRGREARRQPVLASNTKKIRILETLCQTNAGRIADNTRASGTAPRCAAPGGVLETKVLTPGRGEGRSGKDATNETANLLRS